MMQGSAYSNGEVIMLMFSLIMFAFAGLNYGYLLILPGLVTEC